MKRLNKLSLTKRLSVTLLIAVFLVTLTAAVPVDACRHRHRVIVGHMDLTFVGEPGDLGVLAWEGEISGRIRGRMVFWSLLLEFNVPNEGWAHFKEIWQIFSFKTGKLLLQGVDEGYVTPEARYFMSGEVTVASHRYRRYIGHRVFMFGVINWVDFMEIGTAPGTFLLF